MKDLKLLETPELVDLLAEQTYRFIKLVRTESNREEYDKCKRHLKEIQAELERRKSNKSESKY